MCKLLSWHQEELSYYGLFIINLERHSEKREQDLARLFRLRELSYSLPPRQDSTVLWPQDSSPGASPGLWDTLISGF